MTPERPTIIVALATVLITSTAAAAIPGPEDGCLEASDTCRDHLTDHPRSPSDTLEAWQDGGEEWLEYPGEWGLPTPDDVIDDGGLDALPDVPGVRDPGDLPGIGGAEVPQPPETWDRVEIPGTPGAPDDPDEPGTPEVLKDAEDHVPEAPPRVPGPPSPPPADPSTEALVPVAVYASSSGTATMECMAPLYINCSLAVAFAKSQTWDPPGPGSFTATFVGAGIGGMSSVALYGGGASGEGQYTDEDGTIHADGLWCVWGGSSGGCIDLMVAFGTECLTEVEAMGAAFLRPGIPGPAVTATAAADCESDLLDPLGLPVPTNTPSGKEEAKRAAVEAFIEEVDRAQAHFEQALPSDPAAFVADVFDTLKHDARRQV